jgi:hypothetical protein
MDGKAASGHGKLYCELLIVTFCRIPRAPRSAGDHLTRSRRFPPPWSVEEQPACYVVPAKLLSKDEGLFNRMAEWKAAKGVPQARRIAVNIAKLAELLRKA